MLSDTDISVKCLGPPINLGLVWKTSKWRIIYIALSIYYFSTLVIIALLFNNKIITVGGLCLASSKENCAGFNVP
jgi:hypothetical protein